MTNQHHPFGIWTPWADILCPYCHDERAGLDASRRKHWPRACAPKAHESVRVDVSTQDYMLGRCDDCNRFVWLDTDIAVEQLTARHFTGFVARSQKVKGWMMQTGGMCHAAGVAREGADFYLMVTAECVHDMHEGGGYLVFAYPDEEDGAWTEVYDGPSHSRMCAAILRTLDCASWSDIPDDEYERTTNIMDMLAQDLNPVTP